MKSLIGGSQGSVCQEYQRQQGEARHSVQGIKCPTVKWQKFC